MNKRKSVPDKSFYVVYDSNDRPVAIGYKTEIMRQMHWANGTFVSHKSRSLNNSKEKIFHFEIVPDEEDKNED